MQKWPESSLKYTTCGVSDWPTFYLFLTYFETVSFNQALILTQAPNNGRIIDSMGRIVNNNNNVNHKICRTLKMLLHDWITTSVVRKYYPSCSNVRHLVFFTVAAKANKDTEKPNYETLVYNFDHSYEYFYM